MRPIDLRCEHRRDVPCVDDPAPRLSWALESSERGKRQTAYRIVVSQRGRAAVGQRARRVLGLGRHRLRGPRAAAGERLLVDRAGLGRGGRAVAVERAGVLPDGSARVARAVDLARRPRRSGRAGARVGVGTRRRHHARALPAGTVPAPRVRSGGTGAPRDALRDRPWARRAASQRRAGRRRGARAGVDGLSQAHRVRGARRDRAARRRDERALGDPRRRLVLGLRRLRPQARRRPLRHASRAALRAPPRVRGRDARGGGERRALARDDRADPVLGPAARRALRRAPRARRLDGSGLRRPRLARGAHARARRRGAGARARAADPRHGGAAAGVRDRARARRPRRRPRSEHGRLGPPGGRGRARHDRAAAVRRDARGGRLAARGEPPDGAAAGDVRPARRRARGLRAAVHVPRVPLRRGAGAGGGAGPRRPRRALGHAVDRSVRVLERPRQPAVAQRHLGPARQLPVGPDRLPAARRAARLAGRRAGVPAQRRAQHGRRRLHHQVGRRHPRRAVARRRVSGRRASARGGA